MQKTIIRKYLIALVIILNFFMVIAYVAFNITENTGKLYLIFGITVLFANFFLVENPLKRIDYLFILWLFWALLISKYWNLESFFLGIPASVFFSFLGLNIYLFIGRLHLVKEKILTIKTFIIAGTLMSLSLLYYRQNLGLFNERLDIEGLNSNAIAYYALLTIFLTVFLWLNKLTTWKKLVFISIIIVSILVIFYTGSRKAFLGLLGFGLLVLFAKYKINNIKNILLISVLAAIGLLFFNLTQSSFSKSIMGQRIDEAIKQEQNAKSLEDHLAGRGYHYIQGVQAFKEHPIIGIGLGNINKYFNTRLKSHSEYISMFAETGLIGGLLYFSAYFLIFLKLFKKKKGLTEQERLPYNILIISLLIILLIAIGRWNYDNAINWIYIGIIRSYLN